MTIISGKAFIGRISPIYFYIIGKLVINKSLNSGAFDQDWKNARMIPIYKDDGDINDENNDRPISAIYVSCCKDDRIPCELSD